ncbi:MAG: homoserine kinase [Thermoprotei archaeon]|nr:MAG: homoserine kinase [Thermoprotei archaeon]
MRGYFRAYCSSANLGSGFDVIAVALDAFYDEVWIEIEEASETSVEIVDIRGPYAEEIPHKNNTVIEAVKYFLKKRRINARVYVELWKGIPVGKGVGSSGASAAAAIGALIDAFNLNVSEDEAIEAAGYGEKVSAGTPHFDNVSASFLGGVAVIYSFKPLKVFSFTPRKRLEFVLAIPKVKVPYKKIELMRKVLPDNVTLRKHVLNSGRLAALILGLCTGNTELIGAGMKDYIVEPARIRYVPAYHRVRDYAFEAEARGIALSGAGPSILVLCKGNTSEVRKAVEEAYSEEGIDSEVRVTYPVPARLETISIAIISPI